MPTTFRAYHPDQILLLAPDLREWVPEGASVASGERSGGFTGSGVVLRRHMKAMGVATRLMSHR